MISLGQSTSHAGLVQGGVIFKYVSFSPFSDSRLETPKLPKTLLTSQRLTPNSQHSAPTPKAITNTRSLRLGLREGALIELTKLNQDTRPRPAASNRRHDERRTARATRGLLYLRLCGQGGPRPHGDGIFNWHDTYELELELIQTQMAQKPMLRAEVGMRVRCANKASAE